MRILPTFLAAALFIGAGTALADDYAVGQLEIGQPWARATPPGASTGGGFLTVTNEGETADRLVSAASPIAGRVEIHEMRVTDDVMKMRPIADGVAIPAGETVEFKPGAFHIMFLELKGPIEQGEPVPVTLTFEKAGSIEVEMVVAPPGAPGPEHGHEHEGGH
ncbi:copper chaperone PCu(A)C [Chelativorans sp. M5D2P16]|uniref:copper chaperone PCu(A)C n=1 Tax=Chelativorans sp. M5D2P16 TaxID=3095678 RepID=UPI002ACA9777|nr:copper chaperone PCu(A)C [Chelativorans sp. M5D2P16]MDZ5699567.1 copper chaperone PCu(A)C [Chelativorans sp. M5D2P16]